MAQLPADRTKLAAAQSNMTPSVTAASQKVKDALIEVYDTVDMLNQKVNDQAATPVLPHADGSVVRSKLALKAIGPTQLDDAAVGQSHHQDNGIPSRALPDNVISQRHMSDNSVGTNELINQSITPEKLSADIQNSTNLEVVAARASVPSNKTYNTIKERLDSEIGNLSGSVGVILESFPRIAPESDDAGRMIRAIDSLTKADPSGNGGGGRLVGHITFIIKSPLTINHANLTLEGVNNGAFTIKADPAFVGSQLLYWKAQPTWQFINRTELKNVIFDCSDLPGVTGLILEDWYDLCIFENVKIINFKNTYGLIVQASAGRVCQGIRFEGIEATPNNTTNSPSVLFNRLNECTFNACKFWAYDKAGNPNTVDVVIFRSCNGITVIGGSVASGVNGYVVDTDGVNESVGVCFYNLTIENLSGKGVYFKGSAAARVLYCHVFGWRIVTPVNTDIGFDFAIGCTAQGFAAFTKIDLTANADRCGLIGFASGGTITDASPNTFKMLYDATNLNMNKVLVLANGSKIYDQATKAVIQAKGNTLHILDAAGGTVIAELSTNQSFFNSPFRLAGQSVSTASPAAGAGAAAALPATPAGYVTVQINGTSRQIPYY